MSEEATKKLNKEEFANGLNAIFSSILTNKKEESEQKYGEVMTRLVQEHGDKLKNLQTFHFLIRYEADEAFETILHQMYPTLNRNTFDKVVFLYTHHDFYEQHLEEIIKNKEGWVCSGDKSGWLMNAYLRFLLEGTYPDMNREEKCFWKPHFGTGEEWITYMNSLSSLYYGKPSDYLMSIATLMKLTPEFEKESNEE